MKIRIVFAGLLLVTLATACGTSPTAPTAAAPESTGARFEEKPAPAAMEGGGTMGTGN
jgi:hypothetical protein